MLWVDQTLEFCFVFPEKLVLKSQSCPEIKKGCLWDRTLLVSVSVGWVRRAETLDRDVGLQLGVEPVPLWGSSSLGGSVVSYVPGVEPRSLSWNPGSTFAAVTGEDVGSLDKVRNPSPAPLAGSHTPSVHKSPHTWRASPSPWRPLGNSLLLAWLLIQGMHAHQGNYSSAFTQEHPFLFLPPCLPSLSSLSLSSLSSWRSSATCEIVERCNETNALVSMEDSNACN